VRLTSGAPEPRGAAITRPVYRIEEVAELLVGVGDGRTPVPQRCWPLCGRATRQEPASEHLGQCQLCARARRHAHPEAPWISCVGWSISATFRHLWPSLTGGTHAGRHGATVS